MLTGELKKVFVETDLIYDLFQFEGVGENIERIFHREQELPFGRIPPGGRLVV